MAAKKKRASSMLKKAQAKKQRKTPYPVKKARY